MHKSELGNLIRNKQDEVIGICFECELLISSTKNELIEALNYITRDSIHMFPVLQEILSFLPDEGSFNFKEIYNQIKGERTRILTQEGYATSSECYNSLKNHIGYIVVASARMKQETTPLDRKHAARSIFARSDILHVIHDMHGNWKELEDKYGKWAHNV
jgi:hypothetical protein